MTNTLGEALHQAIHDAETLIPEQGPIGVFIHHNTLHHWEDIPFCEAVETAAKTRGAEPYFSHLRYLEEHTKGRIKNEALARHTQHFAQTFMTAHAIPASERSLCERILTSLLHVIKPRYTSAEVSWLLSPARANALRDQTIRRIWHALPADWGRTAAKSNMKKTAFRAHAAGFTNHITARLAASYLDRGVSYWRNPWRRERFHQAMHKHLVLSYGQAMQEAHLAKLDDTQNAEGLVIELLNLHTTTAEEAYGLVMRELLALPGWAGQFKILPQQEHGTHATSEGLMEYLTARLLLRTLSGYLSEDETEWEWLDDKESFVSPESMRLEIATCLASWPETLPERMQAVEGHGELWFLCLEHCTDFDRRRLWHLAYEDSYYQQAFSALKKAQTIPSPPQLARDATAQTFGAIFCIDEREESFRRYLEATDPSASTYGFAGFFGVDIFVRHEAEGPIIPQCPAPVTPQHVVYERPSASPRRQRWHRFGRGVNKWILHGSRTGPLAMPLLSLGGVAALLPLVIRTSYPYLYRQAVRAIEQWKTRILNKQLVYRREENSDGSLAYAIGFTPQEMSDKVIGMIRILGLCEESAELVAVLGHGATSVNNPHLSAYNCGACGGHRGALNARLFALMANDKEVRTILAERGLALPPRLLFVGGYHDTASEAIELFDQELIPPSHQALFRRMQASFAQAQEWNAAERSRRFASAPQGAPRAALRHVAARAWDFREPRTECGHATNALCVVGSRQLTKKIFFDRRCFLVSYENAQDAQGDILKALLSAVVPVCAGINLEYYFSAIDPSNYGAGTKLPHNVTGLTGVIDGAGGDFRTGLPTQMTELHEPVRLLMIVEAEPAFLLNVMEQLPAVKRLVVNEWMHLAIFRPSDPQPLIYQQGRFVPWSLTEVEVPRIQNALDYCRGHRDHLTPAVMS